MSSNLSLFENSEEQNASVMLEPVILVLEES